MDPADLTQGNLTDWVETAVKAEREAAGLAPTGGAERKQGELNFSQDFSGV